MWDLVIIGAGISGLTAARRAQLLGAKVLVMEKSWSVPGDGNSRQSGSGYGAGGKKYNAPPDELYEQAMKITAGSARPDVARAWAENIAKTFDFHVSQGANYGPDPGRGADTLKLQPPSPQVVGRPWRGAGPDLFLTHLANVFQKDGGEIATWTRARKLIVDDGRVVGVVAATSDGLKEFRSKAVLMCDGGFQANRELVAKYITKEYLIDGGPSDSGDCLQMATEIGAKVVNMDQFYGHVRVRDAIKQPRLSPRMAPGGVIIFSVVVDGNGRRIADENIGGSRMSVKIAHCDTPGDTWVVFDEPIWTGPATHGAKDFNQGGSDVPLNPSLIEAGATLIKADSLQALAKAMKSPMGELERTIARYNDAVVAGDLSKLDPPRTGTATPIHQPPFYAIPLIGGIYFTMGGVLINGKAEVLDRSENVIPGLYASGGTMGGLMGGPTSGYLGGWAEASTFGFIAADSVLASIRQPAGVS
jgi:fumarate reductase flavoprotein subunit